MVFVAIWKYIYFLEFLDLVSIMLRIIGITTIMVIIVANYSTAIIKSGLLYLLLSWSLFIFLEFNL